ncbi:MAG: hypothetical protein A2Y41_00690 [Spirochaetes bacterium GWB1_36_13]|nr:MAG: hypothetical protein A2Y41_00690 [Spirochaetes bacterium GWB1_36_13]
MKEFLKKNRADLLISFFALLFIVFSHLFNITLGKKSWNHFLDFFLEMISFLPFLFILIGLFDAFVSKERVTRHIGNDSGWKGTPWVILLAMLQAGPLYGAFPVAYLLWKKGSSIRNIFIYLGAFSTLKIPMLSFEIQFLGFKFTLLRTLFSLPVFIFIAFFMEKHLSGKNYQMKDGENIKKR